MNTPKNIFDDQIKNAKSGWQIKIIKKNKSTVSNTNKTNKKGE
jgi:hypothetical protein